MAKEVDKEGQPSEVLELKIFREFVEGIAQQAQVSERKTKPKAGKTEKVGQEQTTSIPEPEEKKIA